MRSARDDFFWRISDMVDRLIIDWKNNKNPWPVLSPELIHRTWSSFVDGKSVDERDLDNITMGLRDNILRLQISTILADHEAIPGRDLTEDFLSDEDHEAFVKWMIFDENENLNISDYGLKPLISNIIAAMDAPSENQKFFHLDCILHEVHCRGDLSRFFIDGGRESVFKLPEIDQPSPSNDSLQP